MSFVLIQSAANTRFKHLKKLATSRRERLESGQTLLDGIHLLQSALAHGLPLAELIVSESGLLKPEISAFVSLHDDMPGVILSDALFAQLTELPSPTGVMALFAIPGEQAVDVLHAPVSNVLLLDGVQDPGNVGSILRTAAAAGVSHVMMSDACADAWSPKVLRAGMGAHFGLSLLTKVDLIAYVASLPASVLSVTTALDATHSLYDLDLRQPVVWVMGSEGQGVRKDLQASCNTAIRIPMAGMTESLNVAAATAICLFEQHRQNLV
ncbi:TrmH family RNA methyltransferase [Leeia oryzae]|uniref:TrmH family RNA methyltransferase n=1 Tax=Leeia oryzae TaxID=356662 RepID=UPI000365BCBA|nr:RNA methyltransferase [Leeia oryzae]